MPSLGRISSSHLHSRLSFKASFVSLPSTSASSSAMLSAISAIAFHFHWLGESMVPGPEGRSAAAGCGVFFGSWVGGWTFILGFDVGESVEGRGQHPRHYREESVVIQGSQANDMSLIRTDMTVTPSFSRAGEARSTAQHGLRVINFVGHGSIFHPRQQQGWSLCTFFPLGLLARAERGPGTPNTGHEAMMVHPSLTARASSPQARLLPRSAEVRRRSTSC